MDATLALEETLRYDPECAISEPMHIPPATEVDLEERRVHQIERYLELSREGSLTQEWLDFGNRNAYDITYHYLLTRGF